MEYTTGKKDTRQKFWETIRIGAIHRDTRKAKKTGNEFEFVSLETIDGKIHSTAFANVWDGLKVDMSSINKGDELAVEYVMNGDYKNFTRVIPVKPADQGDIIHDFDELTKDIDSV